MDVIFNCPHCDQELAVDSSGTGTQIDCPSCGEAIVIPAPAGPQAGAEAGNSVAAEPRLANPIAASAAARVQLHLKVPARKVSESLIEKPLAPLDAAAKDGTKRIKTKTIRHLDCIEVGHDRFDEMVTNFLVKIGEENIISINTLNYSYVDIGTQKLLTDFGILIVYRG